MFKRSGSVTRLRIRPDCIEDIKKSSKERPFSGFTREILDTRKINSPHPSKYSYSAHEPRLKVFDQEDGGEMLLVVDAFLHHWHRLKDRLPCRVLWDPLSGKLQ